MSEPVVDVDSITVRYNGTTALTEVKLRAQAGERVALVGPSGSGKSSLLAAINGLVTPDAGAVRLFGVDLSTVRRRASRRLRNRTGTIHQQFALVGALRVVHNVNAGRLGRWSTGRALWSLVSPRDRREVHETLDRVGIGDKIWTRTDQLSGGEQQRVAVARVLHQHPELVLADEPVSSLDPARSEEVMSLLTGICDLDDRSCERALVASMHDAALARRHFDRLVGLRSGAVMFDLAADDVDDALLDELYSIEIRPPS